jgi:hypothetical protein
MKIISIGLAFLFVLFSVSAQAQAEWMRVALP